MTTGTFTLEENFNLIASEGLDGTLILSTTMTFVSDEFIFSIWSVNQEDYSITTNGKSFSQLDTSQTYLYGAPYDTVITLNDNLYIVDDWVPGGTLEGSTIYLSGNIGLSGGGAPTSGTSKVVFNGSGVNIWGSPPISLDVTINVTGELRLQSGGMYQPTATMGDGTLTWLAGDTTGGLNFAGNVTVISNGHSWSNVGIGIAYGSALTLTDNFTVGAMIVGASVGISGAGTLSVSGILPMANDFGGSSTGTITLLSDMICRGTITTYTAPYHPFKSITINGTGKKCYVGGSLNAQSSKGIYGTAEIVMNGTGYIEGWEFTNPITIDTSGTITLGIIPYNTGVFKYVSGSIVNTGNLLTISGSCGMDTASMPWKSVTVSNTATVTLGSNMSISGTFTLTGATTFVGAHNIACGAFAPSSSTHTLSGNITASGSWAIAESKTFLGSHTITTGAITVSSAATITMAGALVSTGVLTLSNTTTLSVTGGVTCAGMTCGVSKTHTINCDIDCNGAFTSNTAGTTVTINGAYIIYVSGNFNAGSYGVSSLLNGTISYVMDGTGTITTSNYYASAMSSTAFTINTTGTITIGLNFFYKTGILRYVSGTIVHGVHTTLGLVGSCTVDTSGMTWHDVSIGAAGTISLLSPLNMVGQFVLSWPSTFVGNHLITCSSMRVFSSGAHTLSGDVDCSGTLTIDTANTTINGSGKTIYVGGGLTLTGQSLSGTALIVMDGTGEWTCSNSSAVVYSSLEFDTAGTVTVSGNVYYSTGSLIYSSGTVVTNGSTLNLKTPTASVNTDGILWNNVSTSGTGIISAGSSMQIAGILTIGSGTTLYTGSNQVTLRSNLVNSSGSTAIIGTGTFIFDGNSIISGDTEFYNLEINPGKTLTVTAGTTQTISNAFFALGNSSNRITLNSTGGEAYLSKASGLAVCNNIDVTSVSATGGAKWYAGNSSVVVSATGWTLQDWDTITLSPPAGTFGLYEWITMSSFEPALEIRYTIDSSDPTYLSTTYTVPFKITGTVIKARGYLYSGLIAGDVYTFVYNSTPLVEPSGFLYDEYYLYSDKAYEVIPSGVTSYALYASPQQNAPIVVTPSGYERTTPNDPWALVSGGGKWRKVGFGGFTVTASGTVDTQYDEFCLHPNASGTLVFNKPTPRNMYVEYESGPSGYYVMDTIDFNPVRNETGGGFIHWVSSISSPSSLYVVASPNSIWADGYQFVRLTATMLDDNFDRVPNKRVIFEVQNLQTSTPPAAGVWSKLGWLQNTAGSIIEVDASGAGIKVSETTNVNGEAKATWHPYQPSPSGGNAVQVIKAYYADASGLADTASILQYFFIAIPFTLDISLLSTADYLI